MTDRWLGLLRGINVGGRNKVPMERLRAAASELGWTDVSTYIASGNLLFGASGEADELAGRLSAALERELGLRLDVVVVDAATLRQALAENPFGDGDPKRVHVGFASVPLTSATVDALTALASPRERFAAHRRVLYADFADGVHGSKAAAAVPKVLRPGFITLRNLATTSVLDARLSGGESE